MRVWMEAAGLVQNRRVRNLASVEATHVELSSCRDRLAVYAFSACPRLPCGKPDLPRMKIKRVFPLKSSTLS